MDLVNHVNTWAQGDMSQGKVMIVAGIMALIATFLAWKNGGEMLRGMIIPLVLITLMNLGYGSFMQSHRAGIAKQVAAQSEADPEGVKSTEYARISKDCKNYGLMNYVWTVMVAVGIILIFFSSSSSWKGAALGIILLASSGFVVDNFLHQRAESYLNAIRE